LTGVQVTRLWLTDFRSYRELELALDLGLTAIIGANGMGKTNLLEALGVLASLKSFRGAPTESVIRKGAAAAIVRAEGFRDGRDVLIELELGRSRIRAQVNRQRLRRGRDLLGALRVTVFAPDDLSLLKEGPAVRREYLDDVLVGLDPTADAVLREFERALKQRNALLKQCHGRLDDAALLTLDVWDDKLASAGTEVTRRREELVGRLLPQVQDAYTTLASASGVTGDRIGASYVRSWSGPSLADGLGECRDTDVRRGVTTVGPHRDELAISLNGMASRTEASQGEQRTLALAMRLATHRLLADVIGEPPLLLLDDVLSELDVDRADALLANLPPGQTVITSATELPASINPDRLLRFDPTGGDLIEDRS
jgi:DNA replication and repair protein RecF